MKQPILVVDDEMPMRELLAEFFRKRGYQVVTAATSEEALRAAEEASPQLVIQDIDLAEADSDGLTLLATLKAAHPTLPVIMLTGLGFDDDLLQEALQNGASDYVSKMLPLDNLLMTVHRILNYNKQPVT